MMCTTLVVPLDGSQFAARALPVAMMMGNAAGARMRVVGVARSDAELAWTYANVHGTALAAGIAACDIEVMVDPDPIGVLLDVVREPRNVLCVATRDRMRHAARRWHSGARLVEHARHPFIAVGAHAMPGPPGSDVVVALDGRSDPERFFAAAVVWARRLHAAVRLVTVYEPVLPDLRDPEHFSRDHGPGCDPGAYLEEMRTRVVALGAASVEVAAIPDPVSVTVGLEEHLAANPAALLLVGGRHAGLRVGPGVLYRALPTVPTPVLVVNHGS